MESFDPYFPQSLYDYMDRVDAIDAEKKYNVGEITDHKFSVHSRHNWCRICKAPALAHAEEE